MSAGSLVFVTGISGFLGSHIVHRLLESGYRVRGAVRSAKLSDVSQWYAAYGDKYQVVSIDDVASGDFSDALKGVDAVIHAAAPLPGRAPPAEVIDGALEGSLNVFRQAEKSGIKSFVYISTILTAISGAQFGDQVWFEGTKDQALDGTRDPGFVYKVAKTLAEKAVWAFANHHPHIEVTVLNPPIIYGPFSPGYRNPDAKLSALSTNEYLYNFLRPDGPLPFSPANVDVRDVARAAVNGLRSPPSSKVGRKRVILSGEWFSPKDAVTYISEVHPELKDRVSVKAKSAPPAPPTAVDNVRTKEILGLEAMIPWKKTVIDAVDDLLRFEKEWQSKGLVPS